MNQKVKGVAFNLDDPDQAELLAHASKRKNFSSYIKRLIARDMERSIMGDAPPSKKQPENPKEPDLELNDDNLGGLV